MRDLTISFLREILRVLALLEASPVMILTGLEAVALLRKTADPGGGIKHIPLPVYLLSGVISYSLFIIILISALAVSAALGVGGGAYVPARYFIEPNNAGAGEEIKRREEHEEEEESQHAASAAQLTMYCMPFLSIKGSDTHHLPFNPSSEAAHSQCAIAIPISMF